MTNSKRAMQGNICQVLVQFDLLRCETSINRAMQKLFDQVFEGFSLNSKNKNRNKTTTTTTKIVCNRTKAKVK